MLLAAAAATTTCWRPFLFCLNFSILVIIVFICQLVPKLEILVLQPLILQLIALLFGHAAVVRASNKNAAAAAVPRSMQRNWRGKGVLACVLRVICVIGSQTSYSERDCISCKRHGLRTFTGPRAALQFITCTSAHPARTGVNHTQHSTVASDQVAACIAAGARRLVVQSHPRGHNQVHHRYQQAQDLALMFTSYSCVWLVTPSAAVLPS